MNVYLVLLHYPVYNKHGEVISTSVVIHDIHDMARCGKTFGIKKFYIVQPFEGERDIVNRIKKFWEDGGKRYNPNRAEAVKIVSVKQSFREVLNEVKVEEKKNPILVGTSAKERGKHISYRTLSAKIVDDNIPVVLIFGTGWGIASEIEDTFDYFLPPIQGSSNYNHLSVRSAAAIVMDRILGGRK